MPAIGTCLRGASRPPIPPRDDLSKEMSVVFGIHSRLILAYHRSRSSSRDAPNCQGNEAGARKCIGLFHWRRWTALGGKLLSEFEVGAFAATFAASQINRLLALAGWCYRSKHGARATMRTRWCLFDL